MRMKEHFIFLESEPFKRKRGKMYFWLGEKRTIVEKGKHFFGKNSRKMKSTVCRNNKC
jgi:hypothetical protein